MANILVQAARISAGPGGAFAKGPPPPPPPDGPPRWLVVQRLQAERAAKAAAADQLEQQRDELERGPFDPLREESKHEVNSRQAWARKRRASIGDPCEVSKRLGTVRRKLAVNGWAKRRDSLPDVMCLRTGVIAQSMTPEARESVADSLSMFRDRQGGVDTLFLELQKFEQALQDPATFTEDERAALTRSYSVKVIHALKDQCFLTPRLPIDIRGIIRSDGRRRTIAEPERLDAIMRQALRGRGKFARLVNVAQRRFGMQRRRRSFDHGEERDRRAGLARRLGFAYEHQSEAATTMSLDRDRKVRMGIGMGWHKLNIYTSNSIHIITITVAFTKQ
jgi:hypothetical protein